MFQYMVRYTQASWGGTTTNEALFDEEVYGTPVAALEAATHHYLEILNNPHPRPESEILNTNPQVFEREITEWLPVTV